MPKPDPAVIDGLRAAVSATPDNHALRLHLAELLVESGEPAEALQQCEAVLEAEPDNEAALELAARAGSPKPIKVSGKSRSNVRRLHAIPGENAEAPSLTLADVGGLEPVKKRLRNSFLAPLKNPALTQMYGKSLRGGLLLWGPPGCGKTFIARATAGELGAGFQAIGLHDVLDLYFGESERQLHEIFEDARKNAPTLLFFDEVDALGRKRGQLRHTGGLREVVAQFLAELDGFGDDNEGVFVLAATNHPWDVDTALRRPGRFDRMQLVLPPDREARQAILSFHLRERPVGDVDIAAVAERTEMFSGADLAHVCESAAELALEDALETGVPRPIETTDLLRCVDEVRPSTIPWLRTARTYAEFAEEGDSYEELLAYLDERGL
jgi:SpoVK/Ycf46/Vps4 family AAA+-type ATPase